MDMSYIIENKSNRLKTTFPNIFNSYRSIRPIYHTSKKIIFMKKSHIFGLKMCSRRANIGSIRKPRQSQVRINIPYKPIILDFSYQNIRFFDFFLDPLKNSHFWHVWPNPQMRFYTSRQLKYITRYHYMVFPTLSDVYLKLKPTFQFKPTNEMSDSGYYSIAFAIDIRHSSHTDQNLQLRSVLVIKCSFQCSF